MSHYAINKTPKVIDAVQSLSYTCGWTVHEMSDQLVVSICTSLKNDHHKCKPKTQSVVMLQG
eukprot:1008460-Amphidinium_carterae.1